MLDMVEAVSPVDAVEVVVGDVAATLGAEQVSFLIADLSGDTSVRFVRPVPRRRRHPAGSEGRETLSIAGTPYEQALVSEQSK